MTHKHFIGCTIALVGFFMFTSLGMAQSDPDFAKANDEYGKGQFEDAIRDYEGLTRSGQWSGALFYNLGNAYFRTGNFGRAILNYERALALEPNHPEATANLVLARDEARALELPKHRSDVLLKFVTPNQMTVAAAVGFWIVLFVFAAIVWSRRRSILLIAILIVCGLITVISIAGIYRAEKANKTLAIVTDQNVQARVATADNASSVLHLPAGSQVQILSGRGDWVYAMLPNNLRGWIPSRSIDPVRL
jgi:tetratricopeptide (TPR) repeat protein